MQLKNLTMSFGTQVIFQDVNLHIPDNEKIGVVGVNGAGKTTLFKIIKGIVQPDSGKVIIEKKARVEWLPQVISDEVPNLNISVFDFLLSARPIKELEDKLQTLYIEVALEQDEKKQKKY